MRMRGAIARAMDGGARPLRQSARTCVRYLEIVRAAVRAEAAAVAWREDINQVARPALWLDCLAARAPALPTFGLRTPKAHREARQATSNRQHAAYDV